MRELHTFDLVHPALQLGCFLAILVLTMTTIQPLFLALSLVAALLLSIYTRGWLSTLKSLAWLVPLIILCSVINPLFSAIGSTELFRIGSHAVYLESFAYGTCMGAMLASVILWFMNATRLLSSDKVLSVLGNILPTIGLMISMTMRLVPQFVERGNLIKSTTQAASAAKPRTRLEEAGGRIRLVSVLMGWSMEDSLETSDAMRARGWGAVKKRTHYQRYRFAAFDTLIAMMLLALVVITAVLAWLVCSAYAFYPVMSSLGPWWYYLPYAVLMFLPLIICLADDLTWKRLS